MSDPAYPAGVKNSDIDSIGERNPLTDESEDLSKVLREIILAWDYFRCQDELSANQPEFNRVDEAIANLDKLIYLDKIIYFPK